ncbi:MULTISPECIES: hypothetical protein [Paraburkholderia]|uniref:hypothetical protein n=1 Tax=Paraburkholderia TaxID=1822464 RepID=UPI001FE918A5|nr:hypothetical protein [Paraburkholderia podalyriae]
MDESFDFSRAEVTDLNLFVGSEPDLRARAILAGLKARDVKSTFVQYVESLPGEPTTDGVLAAICATFAWDRSCANAFHASRQRAFRGGFNGSAP